MTFFLVAFSSREAVPASLENAPAFCLVAFSSREAVPASLENAPAFFLVAFSSREAVPASLENAPAAIKRRTSMIPSRKPSRPEHAAARPREAMRTGPPSS